MGGMSGPSPSQYSSGTVSNTGGKSNIPRRQYSHLAKDSVVAKRFTSQYESMDLEVIFRGTTKKEDPMFPPTPENFNGMEVMDTT